MAKCASCGKMKCACGGMAHRTKKMMGGMAMAPAAMTRPGFPSRGPASGGMTRPGTMVKPPRGRMPMKKGGMAYGAGGGMGRMEKSMGGSVRRKGSCGKNN